MWFVSPLPQPGRVSAGAGAESPIRPPSPPDPPPPDPDRAVFFGFAMPVITPVTHCPSETTSCSLPLVSRSGVVQRDNGGVPRSLAPEGLLGMRNRARLIVSSNAPPVLDRIRRM